MGKEQRSMPVNIHIFVASKNRSEKHMWTLARAKLSPVIYFLISFCFYFLFKFTNNRWDPTAALSNPKRPRTTRPKCQSRSLFKALSRSATFFT